MEADLEENSETPQKPKRGWFRRVLAFSGLMVGALAVLEVLILFSDMSANSALRISNPEKTAFIRRYEIESGNRVALQWRELSQISPHLAEAVLVAEDDLFFEHEGLNIEELKKSWELNLKKKKWVRGGSTLTMQLVKNLYFSSEKNPIRKFNEILLALDLEKKLSKDRILEIYLNVVQWGSGIYGAENASQYYFKKPAKNLNAEEGAYLAAILPNPVYFTTQARTRTQRRKAMILRRMSRASFPISQTP